MKNLGVYKLVEAIRELNSEYICMEYLFGGFVGSQPIILTDADLSTLQLPDGYYVTSSGVTNKFQTSSGSYELFPVLTADQL